MAESATSGGISLIHYREYLLLLARVRFDPRLQGHIDPSDIVQEALLKAHRALDQFRGETEQQLAAWLRTILTNTLANVVRDHGRRHAGAEVSLDRALDGSSTCLEVALATGQLSPEEVASHNEELLRLARAIARLPEDQRLVMEMKHLQGYALADICERMGRSKSAVMGLLHRGMKALRVFLEDADSVVSPDTARLS
jgi:RNA polymerase sigma-70 factor (ECF subfamily)